MDYTNLARKDKQVWELTQKELKRQQETLMMIPSENYASRAVLEALATPFTNKYAEGEPGKRYYQGNEIVDELELLVNKRALQAFGLKKSEWHVNVKAISASYANLAVLSALLEPGQKILAMNLPDGGHLSHGWDLRDGRKVTFSSKVFKIRRYKVERQTGRFDYKKIESQAKRFKPHIIISGGTAYPREISHARMGAIARRVGAYYLADIAHEAGLIIAGANKSPFPHADIVTISTQKTLRGPRGSIIICRKNIKGVSSFAKASADRSEVNLASKIDRAIFPGLQGGPFMNNIAAIGVALKEARSKKFREYAQQTVKNAKVLASSLRRQGFKLSSDGTDKHLFLIDSRYSNLSLRGRSPKQSRNRVGSTGVESRDDNQIIAAEIAERLEKAGIIVNKNTVPYETGTPMNPSGIRLGTPALTTRGMQEREMKQVAKWIGQVIREEEKVMVIKKHVKELVKQFPIYADFGR